MKLSNLNEDDSPKNRFGEPISHEPPTDSLIDPEKHEAGGREYQKWIAKVGSGWDQFQAHLREQGAEIDRVVESALVKDSDGQVEELQIVRHKDKWGHDRPDLDILRGRLREGDEWGDWSEFTETQGYKNVQKLMDEYLSFGDVEYHIKH